MSACLKVFSPLTLDLVCLSGCFHLVANNQRFALRIPGQGEGIAKTLDLVDTVLGAHVPELDDAIVAHTAELCLLDRIEGDFLNGGIVTLELCGKADERPLRVPCQSGGVSL